VTARKRPRKVAPPVRTYDEHCQRTAAEAEGWIARYGRGSWNDEMTARRGRDAARLVSTMAPAAVPALVEQLPRQCRGCGHMFISTAHDVCELCHVMRERVSVADGLFGGAA
jgi:hypothetical protein